LCGGFEAECQEKLIADSTLQLQISLLTEATALASAQIDLLQADKAKLRSVLQSVIKHIKSIKALYANAAQSAEPVTKGLHEILRQKIAAGLKLK
jgi:hypothetical protein